uniref:5-hydroxytryptamine receptor 7-like n=1 Tax=Saccoglossus kowalevskii TaxID=10224 RepID=A0ABM0MXW6_SACKO|nr:PREDICTED: 5-hydroxytryptamine receptor 7-like [Saccoglossus kowalevskii]
MADYNNTTFGNFTGNSTNNTDEVTTLEPRAPSIAEAILAALIVLIICSTLVNNFFVLFVFGKVPRLRTPGPMYFLVLLAITQFFGVIFSLVPSLVSVIMGGEWIMGNVFDDVSAYMANLCYHLTVHTLGIICFERYLRICRPLKHEEIFSETVTVIILFGIIFFDCVLAIFHS